MTASVVDVSSSAQVDIFQWYGCGGLCGMTANVAAPLDSTHLTSPTLPVALSTRAGPIRRTLTDGGQLFEGPCGIVSEMLSRGSAESQSSLSMSASSISMSGSASGSGALLGSCALELERALGGAGAYTAVLFRVTQRVRFSLVINTTVGGFYTPIGGVSTPSFNAGACLGNETTGQQISCASQVGILEPGQYSMGGGAGGTAGGTGWWSELSGDGEGTYSATLTLTPE